LFNSLAVYAVGFGMIMFITVNFYASSNEAADPISAAYSQ
jgi:hypothetical protein